MPLYRQFLTGTSTSRELQTWNTNCSTDAQKATDACRWPFVRMGGQSTYQRSTLTANHGTYFLDTSVSFDTQWQNKDQGKKEAFTNVIPCDNTNVKPSDPCTPRSVNVFKGGQTYYMFFLFAKPETKQTYQIYVGPGFTLKANPDDADSDLHAISPVLDSMPMPSIGSAKWPSKWKANYNDDAACGLGKAGCGVLQVTVDFSGQTDLDPKSQCKPATFCEVKNGGACGCSLTASDPLALADPVRMDSTGAKEVFGGILGACQKACSQWAVKDLDFPGKGPLGFSFKMPGNFTADDKGWAHRPAPTGLSHDPGYRPARLADHLHQHRHRTRPFERRVPLRESPDQHGRELPDSLSGSPRGEDSEGAAAGSGARRSPASRDREGDPPSGQSLVWQ